MNRIVTIGELARTVAQFNSCHESDALAFVRETFALAYETLAAGDAVVIKGLGEFSGTEGSVLYRPDRELADAVNAPFAAFSAVELPDGMDLIEDDQPSGDGDDVAETGIDPEPVVVDMQQEPACAEDIPAGQDSAREIDENADSRQNETVCRNDSACIDHDSSVPADAVVSCVCDDSDGTRRPRRRNYAWIWILAMALGCLEIGFLAGRLSAPSVAVVEPTDISADTEERGDGNAEDDCHRDETAPVAADNRMSDSIACAAESLMQQHTVVTDTVRAGRFLTTMARIHYGQMEYWVYIYMENAGRLGDPDRLEAGTVVVIPPASKYGLVAGDAAKIREATAKAAEIYTQYKKG